MHLSTLLESTSDLRIQFRVQEVVVGVAETEWRSKQRLRRRPFSRVNREAVVHERQALDADVLANIVRNRRCLIQRAQLVDGANSLLAAPGTLASKHF